VENQKKTEQNCPEHSMSDKLSADDRSIAANLSEAIQAKTPATTDGVMATADANKAPGQDEAGRNLPAANDKNPRSEKTDAHPIPEGKALTPTERKSEPAKEKPEKAPEPEKPKKAERAPRLPKGPKNEKPPKTPKAPKQEKTLQQSAAQAAAQSSLGRAPGQGRPRHLLRQHPQSLNNPRNQRKHLARTAKTKSSTST